MACIFCDKPCVFFDVPQRGIFVAIITEFFMFFFAPSGDDFYHFLKCPLKVCAYEYSSACYRIFFAFIQNLSIFVLCNKRKTIFHNP